MNPVLTHAKFQWVDGNGEAHCVVMTKEQFEQALSDARVCGCGQCVACRAGEYNA